MVDSSLKLKALKTVAGVLDAIGRSRAAALADCSVQNMTNAIARGRLPHSTFLIFSSELHALGFSAPPELWGIKSKKKR